MLEARKPQSRWENPGNPKYQLSCADRMIEPLSEIPWSLPMKQNEISSSGFVNELKCQVFCMIVDVPDVIHF